MALRSKLHANMQVKCTCHSNVTEDLQVVFLYCCPNCPSCPFIQCYSDGPGNLDSLASNNNTAAFYVGSDRERVWQIIQKDFKVQKGNYRSMVLTNVLQVKCTGSANVIEELHSTCKATMMCHLQNCCFMGKTVTHQRENACMIMIQLITHLMILRVSRDHNLTELSSLPVPLNIWHLNQPSFYVHTTHRFQKLIYLYLPIDCFMKISFQFTRLPIEHSTMCDSRINLNYMVILW